MFLHFFEKVTRVDNGEDEEGDGTHTADCQPSSSSSPLIHGSHVS